MIISLHAYRHTRRLVEVLPVQYTDAEIARARELEQQMYGIELAEKLLAFSAAMAGNKPGDTE